jgi:hypothetical protein
MADRRLLAIGIANVIALALMAASLAIAIAWRGFDVMTVAEATLAGTALYFGYLFGAIGWEAWGPKRTAAMALVVVTSCAYTAGVVYLQRGFLHGATGPLWMPIVGVGRSLVMLMPLVMGGAWFVTGRPPGEWPAIAQGYLSSHMAARARRRKL